MIEKNYDIIDHMISNIYDIINDINYDKRYDIIDQIYDIIVCYDIIVKL